MIPSVYTVDLSQEPGKRWDKIVSDYTEYLPLYHKFIRDTFRDAYGKWLGNFIVFLLYICSWLSLFRNNEYFSELYGISKITASHGLTYADLFQLNFGYDFLFHCTSIIVRDGDKTWHLRNLDFDGDVLRKMTINVNFQIDGKIIYKGTTWVGFVGLVTGLSQNTNHPFTISLNSHKPNKNFVYNILRFLWGIQPIAFTIRRQLEQGDYYKAESFLKTTLPIAPCHIVMGGCTNSVHIKKIPLLFSNHFNYTSVHTLPIIKSDRFHTGLSNKKTKSKQKKESGMEIIKKLKDFSIGHLFVIMQSYPFATYRTIYTTVMSPTDGTYITKVYPAID